MSTDVDDTTGSGHHQGVTAVLERDVSLLDAVVEQDPSVVDKSTADGSTLCHFAAWSGAADVMSLLLAAGSEIDAVNGEGQTPLAVAIIMGHVACARVLLEAGADGHARDRYGCTPFHLACLRGNLEMARLVMTSCNPLLTAKDNQDRTPVHTAAESGSAALLEFVLGFDGAEVNGKDKDGQTPLHIAAIIGSHECVSFLLAQPHVEVNVADKYGALPIHCAAMSGSRDCFAALSESIRSSSPGQDPLTVADGLGMTVVHYAAQNGCADLVTHLLGLGVAADAPDTLRCTPLLHAAAGGHVDVANRLHSAGANAAHVDVVQATLLHKAAASGVPDMVTRSLSWLDASSVNQRDDEGATPLMKAAILGHVDVCTVLLEKGADPNVRDAGGSTALHAASFAGHTDVIAALLRCPSVDPSIEDTDGALPLHNAACADDAKAVAAFAEASSTAGASPRSAAKGFDVNHCDASGRTALHMALLNSNESSVLSLLKLKADPNIPMADGSLPTDFAVAHDDSSSLVVALALKRAGGKFNPAHAQLLADAEAPVRRASAASAASSKKIMSGLQLQQFKRGLQLFSQKPKQGLAFFVAQKFLPDDSAASVAKFLFDESQLSRASVGEVLGSGGNEEIAREYLRQMDFTSMRYLAAFRSYVTRFQLPLESGPINRLVEAFAERYFEQHPYSEDGSGDEGDCVFKDTDAVYVLTYAVLQLNTDLYNDEVKKKMTLPVFMEQVRGVNGGDNFDEQFIHDVFEEVRTNEIRMETKDSSIGSAEREGWLIKRGGRVPSKKKRWFVLSANDMMLYYFKKKGDSAPIGWIPLENLSIGEDRQNPNIGFILSATSGVIKSVKLTDGRTKQGNHRSFQMLAPSMPERDEWVKALKSNITKNPFKLNMQDRARLPAKKGSTD